MGSDVEKISSASNSTYSNQEAALALLLGGARLFPLGTLGARVQELVEDREISLRLLHEVDSVVLEQSLSNRRPVPNFLEGV